MPIVKVPAGKIAATTDGRALRSERSQKAIVDAMGALVAERPDELTLETVAARAGVSVRTVFRHFRDTDALFEALYERFGTEAIRLGSEWTPVGSFEGDLAALIDARLRMFVYLAPLRSFARVVRLPPPRVRERFAEVRSRARAQIRSIFVTHGAPLADDELEALDAWISLEVWERLRDQGCTRARANRVMHTTARTLARAAAKVPRKARAKDRGTA